MHFNAATAANQARQFVNHLMSAPDDGMEKANAT
jgi:hypothetical protein